MGVRNFLVEGVSGTGKTSVCEELNRRGYLAIHGDRELAYQGDPETGEPTGSATHEHHIWDVRRVRDLVADQHEPVTFFCGGSRNFESFIELFDEVFVLEVNLETLHRRLDQRSPDEWGSRPSERALIVRLHRTREDVPWSGVTVDASAPLADVVDEILRVAGLSPSAGRASSGHTKTRPELRTERLRLVPTTEAHVALLAELDSDVEVMRYLTGRAVAPEEARAAWTEALIARTDRIDGLGRWSGFTDSSFVGWWALHATGETGAAELGYRLRRDAWGHGYATEGLRAILAHAFETVGLTRVWAETMAVNARSRSVLRKAGLRHVRTEVREWDEPLPGAELGEVVYELDRSSYVGR